MTRILGISGSIRAASFNTALLNALPALAPEGTTIEVFKGIDELPHFNEDLEADVPASVVRLREAVRSADGIVISTPEYNRSVPGVLKNALDWASRPYGQSSWFGKPVAVLSASPGAQGGIRAQEELRSQLRNLGAYVVHGPEIAVPEVHTRLSVDEQARATLTDPATAGMATFLLNALEDAVRANTGGTHTKSLGAWMASLAG
ncbi:NAD(P)H-dependent oxidoreductase [Yinghuangia sp. ASG 101]|uniref:NADPH-dependent FMN reductase n=1 Tax=Yinghuangia sp. ASG 101 TaxID=2896848 RepID=UPI001E5BE008|nr:NAD(P)H-dependent oxidoreductase [Yinghuangia sp. ASG 101]UGQ13931.1 NAD(P)H-dependent oxidoreductase [Yinghuangia sp. ASG 101]